jgi:hypothetical protein
MPPGINQVYALKVLACYTDGQLNVLGWAGACAWFHVEFREFHVSTWFVSFRATGACGAVLRFQAIRTGDSRQQRSVQAGDSAASACILTTGYDHQTVRLASAGSLPSVLMSVAASF